MTDVHPDDARAWGLDLPGRGPWQEYLVTSHHSTEPEIGIEIFTDAHGAALKWNDYVVNEWIEFFDSTALAIARMAVLVEAVDKDRQFATAAESFAEDAQRLFDRHLT